MSGDRCNVGVECNAASLIQLTPASLSVTISVFLISFSDVMSIEDYRTQMQGSGLVA